MRPLTDSLPVTPGPSYAKLRPGPNGPGPELVARHQRARLYDSMVAMVVARGVEKATIKDICALAGVSRRTFYALVLSGRYFASIIAVVERSLYTGLRAPARQYADASVESQRVTHLLGECPSPRRAGADVPPLAFRPNDVRAR